MGRVGQCRIPWQDRYSVCAGMTPDGALYDTAFLPPKLTKPDANGISTSSYYQILKNSKDFKSLVDFDGSVGVNAWSMASFTGSFSYAKKLDLKEDVINVIIAKQHSSDHPATVTVQDLKLTPVAQEILASGGPEAFRKAYGSRYVAGYVFGGSFLGTYRMKFGSNTAKELAEAKVDASFQAFVAQGQGHMKGRFEKELAEVQFEREAYACTTGYTGPHIPAAATLDELWNASKELKTGGSAPLLTILWDYRQVPSYQEALRQYHGRMPEEQLDEETVASIMRSLSDHYIQYEYLLKLLKGKGFDGSSAIPPAAGTKAELALYELATKIHMTVHNFPKTFSSDGDYKNLDIFYQQRSNACMQADPRYKLGEAQAAQFCNCVELTKEVHRLLTPPPPPVNEERVHIYSVSYRQLLLTAHHDGKVKGVEKHGQPLTEAEAFWKRVMDDGTVTFRSSYDKYLSSSSGGELTTAATSSESLGTRFKLVQVRDGNPPVYLLRTRYGKHVSTNAFTGTVTTKDNAKAWEEYYVAIF